jgi:hypothetical protein
MELSAPQRQRIEANALQASWQRLTPWLLRHLGTTGATPAVLVDGLLQANARAQAPARELLRHMESRLWSVQAPAATDDARTGLLRLQVVCGGLHWTLWLQRPPMMHLMDIRR